MKRFRTLFIAGAMGLSVLLSGCTALLVGGAVTGAAVIHDRRTPGTIVDDQDIQLRAMRIRDADAELNRDSNISITTYNLKILLTGQAKDRAVVDRFVAQLQKLPRITKVYDEVTIGAEGTWADAAEDALTTSQVKLALFGIHLKGFDPTRVKVVTSAGTVYLMGLLTPEEAAAVTNKVRYVSGVQKVVTLFDNY